MQVKKILCIVITLCTLLTGIVPVTYAKEEEPKKVLLEDDFGKGMLNWGTMGAVISEGKMSFPSGWNKAELTPGSLWDANYTLECEFAETGNTGEWEGWNIGGIQFLTRQRLNSEIVYAYNGEGTVGKFKMKVGEHYNVKYVVKPESITVYMKGANETSYRREIGKVSVKLGRHAISFISYSIPTEIYHVKITANSSNGIDQKAMGINVDETEQITFGKGFDTSGLTYESSDTEIAEVSDNGTVTAKKQGTAVIKIKRGEKEVESVFVRSMNKLRSLSFKYDPYLGAHRTKESIEKYGDSVVIEAGETCDLELTCAPSDAFLNQLEWTVDNPEIVELYGLGESTRACTGLKEGKATIHVQARYADTSTNIDVVVLPKSAPAETKNYEFVWDGTKDQLSDDFWGMHIAAADTTLETDRGKASAEILKKIHCKSFRVNQDNMLTRKTWEDGTWKDELRQIAEGANAQNQMLVYDVMPAGQFDPSTTENKTRGYQTFTDEELLEQIQLIKSVLKTELLLELGNEQYALQFAKYFPAVYDYAKWANDFAGKVKALYPEVQAYGCLIDTRSEDNICADSGNFNGYEDDGAYTQGWRVAKWNQAVVDNSSNIDGYTIHPYIGFPEANGVGEKFTLENNYKGQYTMEKTLLETYEIAGRKPFIYTEWGHLDGKMFWGSAEVDKTRRQRSKTPGTALQDIRQILMISRLGFVKTTNYHIFADTQAFGIVDGYYANEDGTRAPMGYAAEAMGKLFSENSYVYDLNCLNPEYSTWFSGVNLKDTNKADAQNVEAYGFGDENGLKTVVFANMTDGDQKMSVKGVSLKPEWSYGSGDYTKLFPDYLRNKRFKTYLEPVLDVYKTDEMLLPVTYDNAAAAETITVPGNSVLIAKVEGTPETDTSYVGDRVGKLAEFQMRNSVIMKVGRNDVWADRRKTKIDESDAVYPVVVNDRTLLPLRFVAEQFRFDVDFNDATREITVKKGSDVVKMTLGSADYTVNGEAKKLDTVPEVVDGRTLVPIRALAEALGKTVYWDDGIIALSEGEKFTGKYIGKSAEELKLLFD